jgi:hypothetical protein
MIICFMQRSGAGVTLMQKCDVTQRLKSILSREGIRVEVLTTAVPPEAREAWYERELKAGMQVCIAHPRLVATDLLGHPSLMVLNPVTRCKLSGRPAGGHGG